jgi:hypothetical protein
VACLAFLLLPDWWTSGNRFAAPYDVVRRR